ncbi:MAG TPA: hypothetical protein VJ806_12135 [Luteimonas sp.]|nr:hypothetical protein [Luteimonas sp.]
MKPKHFSAYEEHDDAAPAWIQAEAPLKQQNAVGLRAPKIDAPGDIGSYGSRGGGDPDLG